jgi:hypothetical protein
VVKVASFVRIGWNKQLAAGKFPAMNEFALSVRFGKLITADYYIKDHDLLYP